MKTKLVQIGMTLVLAMAGCSISHHSPAPITPTPVPTTQPAKIICPDTATLIVALGLARTTPHIIIELSPTTYIIYRTLVVQGDGTTIHGNGAIIVSYVVYDGRIDPFTGRNGQGTPFAVTPTLGLDVPFKATQRNGLWRNPAGTCQSLDAAAGGTNGPGTFSELAPDQDADGKPTATYALFAPYVVPARNITIDNLSIRFASAHCDTAMYVMYAQNVTVDHVDILNQPGDLGGDGGNGGLACTGSQNVTFSACVGNSYIGFNSSTDCTVTNCSMGGVTFEEMCRGCAVTGCTLASVRTNDILCSDITFDGNTFTVAGGSSASLWGGTRIHFTNNKMAGNAWLGSTDTRQCTISGNTGTGFFDFAPASAGNLLRENK